jgi:hypothetical protein
MMLDTLKRRCAKTAAALSPEEQARLLQTLAEARRQYPWTNELSRQRQPVLDYAAVFTEANLEAFAREEEEFDRHFLAQAKELLRPEQFAVFEEVQERHRQSKIAQFRSAIKFLAAKSR